MRARRKGLISLLAIVILLSFWATVETQPRPPDVEYVPTPEDVVTEMLKAAGVTKDDVVYDLGCGDGRFVITASKSFGARGVGIDIDPERIRESNENARKAAVTDRVRFLQQDLFEADINEATVVTLYLLPELNIQLRPKLLRDLRPGTRIVSHEFDMGEWVPDKSGLIRNAKFSFPPYIVFEKDVHYYYWVVPADAAGIWRWNIPPLIGRQDYILRLAQKFQEVRGYMSAGRRRIFITDAGLTGDVLSFVSQTELKGQRVRMRYNGRISGDMIQGSIEIPEGPLAGHYGWTALRSKR